MEATPGAGLHSEGPRGAGVSRGQVGVVQRAHLLHHTGLEPRQFAARPLPCEGVPARLRKSKARQRRSARDLCCANGSAARFRPRIAMAGKSGRAAEERRSTQAGRGRWKYRAGCTSAPCALCRNHASRYLTTSTGSAARGRDRHARMRASARAQTCAPEAAHVSQHIGIEALSIVWFHAQAKLIDIMRTPADMKSLVIQHRRK